MVSSDEDRAFDYGTTPPAERSALAKQASKPNKAGSKSVDSKKKGGKGGGGKAPTVAQKVMRSAVQCKAERGESKSKRQQERLQARAFKELDVTLEVLGIVESEAAASAAAAAGSLTPLQTFGRTFSSSSISSVVAFPNGAAMPSQAAMHMDGSPSPVLRLRMDQAHTLSTSSSNPQLLSSQHPPAHLMPSGSAPDLAASMSRGPSPVSGMPPAAPPARKVRGQRGTSSGGASSSTAEPSLPRSSTTPPRPIPFLSANKSREQLTAQSAAQKSGSHATLGQQAGFHVRQPSSMQGSFAATARRRGSDDQSAFLYNNLRGDSPQGRTTHLVAGTVGSRSSELNVARQFAAQREQLSANINYALDEGPREDDTMQAMAEALDQAETCRQDLLELCTPPDTLGQVEAFVNQLEISVRSAKDILKQVKPHRHLCTSAESSTACSTAVGAMMTELAEAAMSVGEGLLNLVDGLWDSGEEDIRAVFKSSRRIVDAGAMVASMLRKEANSGWPVRSAEMLELRLSRASKALACSTIDATYNSCPSLLSESSLLKDRSVHGTSAQARLLQLMLNECAKLSQRVGDNFTAERLDLGRQLCSLYQRSGELAVEMQSSVASGLVQDGDDDSDSGDDPGAYVGAWGSRTGSSVAGLNGSSSNYPSSRAPLCDEDVQAHGWVPGLLLVLLQRAQEAHQRLRGDLADQNSGAGNGSDSDGSEECSEHYSLLDRMQDTFSQLALANTRRTAALCTAPEPLACWALEILKEQAETALKLVQLYDKGSLGLGDLLSQSTDGDDDIEFARGLELFDSIKASANAVVRRLVRIRKLLTIRRASDDTGSTIRAQRRLLPGVLNTVGGGANRVPSQVVGSSGGRGAGATARPPRKPQPSQQQQQARYAQAGRHITPAAAAIAMVSPSYAAFAAGGRLPAPAVPAYSPTATPFLLASLPETQASTPTFSIFANLDSGTDQLPAWPLLSQSDNSTLSTLPPTVSPSSRPSMPVSAWTGVSAGSSPDLLQTPAHLSARHHTVAPTPAPALPTEQSDSRSVSSFPVSAPVVASSAPRIPSLHHSISDPGGPATFPALYPVPEFGANRMSTTPPTLQSTSLAGTSQSLGPISAIALASSSSAGCSTGFGSISGSGSEQTFSGSSWKNVLLSSSTPTSTASSAAAAVAAAVAAAAAAAAAPVTGVHPSLSSGDCSHSSSILDSRSTSCTTDYAALLSTTTNTSPSTVAYKDANHSETRHFLDPVGLEPASSDETQASDSRRVGSCESGISLLSFAQLPNSMTDLHKDSLPVLGNDLTFPATATVAAPVAVLKTETAVTVPAQAKPLPSQLTPFTSIPQLHTIVQSVPVADSIDQNRWHGTPGMAWGIAGASTGGLSSRLQMQESRSSPPRRSSLDITPPHIALSLACSGSGPIASRQILDAAKAAAEAEQRLRELKATRLASQQSALQWQEASKLLQQDQEKSKPPLIQSSAQLQPSSPQPQPSKPATQQPNPALWPELGTGLHVSYRAATSSAFANGPSVSSAMRGRGTASATRGKSGAGRGHGRIFGRGSRSGSMQDGDELMLPDSDNTTAGHVGSTTEHSSPSTSATHQDTPVHPESARVSHSPFSSEHPLATPPLSYSAALNANSSSGTSHASVSSSLSGPAQHRAIRTHQMQQTSGASTPISSSPPPSPRSITQHHLELDGGSAAANDTSRDPWVFIQQQDSNRQRDYQQQQQQQGHAAASAFSPTLNPNVVTADSYRSSPFQPANTIPSLLPASTKQKFPSPFEGLPFSNGSSVGSSGSHIAGNLHLPFGSSRPSEGRAKFSPFGVVDDSVDGAQQEQHQTHGTFSESREEGTPTGSPFGQASGFALLQQQQLQRNVLQTVEEERSGSGNILLGLSPAHSHISLGRVGSLQVQPQLSQSPSPTQQLSPQQTTSPSLASQAPLTLVSLPSQHAHAEEASSSSANASSRPDTPTSPFAPVHSPTLPPHAQQALTPDPRQAIRAMPQPQQQVPPLQQQMLRLEQQQQLQQQQLKQKQLAEQQQLRLQLEQLNLSQTPPSPASPHAASSALLASPFSSTAAASPVLGNPMSWPPDDSFWSIKWDDLRPCMQRQIGEGSYGQVWAGQYLYAEVAIKVMRINRAEDFDEVAWRRFKLEVDLQRLLSQHPNIVRFTGACCDYHQMAHLAGSSSSDQPPMLAIVMEFCKLGTIYNMVKSARCYQEAVSGGLPLPRENRYGIEFLQSWERRLEVAFGGAAGLAYMHSHKIVHRDLTSSNMLIDQKGTSWMCKVCDFNLSRRLPTFGGNLVKSEELPNSPAWQSPEVLDGCDYNTQSDVFSFGVILWEIITLGVPWTNKDDRPVNMFAIMRKVKDGARLQFPPEDTIPGRELPELTELINIAKSCWEHEPSARPTMVAVAGHLDLILKAIRKRRDAARRH